MNICDTIENLKKILKMKLYQTKQTNLLCVSVTGERELKITLSISNDSAKFASYFEMSLKVFQSQYKDKNS